MIVSMQRITEELNTKVDEYDGRIRAILVSDKLFNHIRSYLWDLKGTHKYGGISVYRTIDIKGDWKILF